MTALYIGGAYQGKETLARSIHGENEKYCFNLHEKVRQALENGQDPMALVDGLQGCIVTCDEVGCGIVPMDAAERQWREAVGRLCCEIARRAELVVRVSAGLPQVIKGELPQNGGTGWN